MRRARGLLTAVTLVGATVVATPARAAEIVSVKDPSACFNEGSAPERKLAFRVVLPAPASDTVEVDYETAGGTAEAGKDFVTTAGTLTFLPGDRRETVRVSIVDDVRDENDETLTLRLTDASGASLGDSEALASICDDDPTPSIGVSDVSVPETGIAKLPVRLTERSGRRVTLGYDAGVAGSPDYTATFGTLVWPRGTKTRFIDVPITDDWYDEPNQIFTVNLHDGMNVGSSQDETWQFHVRILDDDPVPTVSIDDVSINESDAILGSPIPLPLLWSGETEKSPSVHFKLVPLYGNGIPQEEWHATEGFDYYYGEDTLLYGMSAGVGLVYDDDSEVNERFKVVLSDPHKVRITDDSAIVTIVDDDCGCNT